MSLSEPTPITIASAAAGLALGTAYPDPMRASAAFSLELPARLTVSVDVFDVAGRHVRTLAHAQEFQPGRTVMAWDGRDGAGVPAPSGSYLIRLAVGTETRMQRLMVVR